MEYKNIHSVKIEVQMKKIIIFTLKMISPAVFNSHWFVFADMKPLIGGGSSTDQLDTFVPTVFVISIFDQTPTDNGNPKPQRVRFFSNFVLTFG